MTTRSYTVALGKPFVRVSQIIIDYPAPNTAQVRMNEELAVLTDTGVVEKIRDLGDTRFTIHRAADARPARRGAQEPARA